MYEVTHDIVQLVRVGAKATNRDSHRCPPMTGGSGAFFFLFRFKMLVSFATDIDTTLYGFAHNKPPRTRKVNLDSLNIDLSNLKYDTQVVKQNNKVILDACSQLFQCGDMMGVTNLLRVIFHCNRRDIDSIKVLLSKNELSDLIPERTKKGESVGTSPERLALEDRDYRLLRVIASPKSWVKDKPSYIINRES